MNIAELRRLEAKPPLAWNIEDIVAAHAALPELLKALEWQPIDTAPNTGEPIIIFNPHNKQPIEIRPADGEWWRNPISGSCTPTHWRPLPPHGGVDVG